MHIHFYQEENVYRNYRWDKSKQNNEITNEGADFSWNNHKMRKEWRKAICTLQLRKMIAETEDQSQRNKRNMTNCKLWNINGTYIYPVPPYLKNKGRKSHVNQTQAQCKQRLPIIYSFNKNDLPCLGGNLMFQGHITHAR